MKHIKHIIIIRVMGIPSYFSFIVKNHHKIIKELSALNDRVDNFYLDCNSIIYDCVHKIDLDEIKDDMKSTIIINVFNKIEEYVNFIKPTNLLFISFDGVAPVAKLEQQRNRRYKSNYQTNMYNNIFTDKKIDKWNTASITPGTEFMKMLNEKIRKKFNNPAKYKLNKIILSLSDDYGEGEHKIFQYIRDTKEEHKNCTNVVYGLDADLIMLSLNHLPINNKIYLFRETPAFVNSINIELEPNKTYLLDIPELANTIIIDMNNGRIPTTEQGYNRLYDYIFMCFFLGNDFLPHFPSVNIRTTGIDKMFNAYCATIGMHEDENLTNGKVIYWRNVKKLVRFLADNEEDYLKTETHGRAKREAIKPPNKTMEDKWKLFENKPTYNRQREKIINVFNAGWESRYYKQLFDIEIDEIRKKQICVNYLEGIEWTMKYYTTGCPDWRWCYNYNYPPLLNDLIHYIPFFESEFIVNKPENPVNELVQLCYVLPRQSMTLLPEKLRIALLSNHDSWYKEDCDFIWAYCKYFWESHVDLPHIEIQKLEEFVCKTIS